MGRRIAYSLTLILLLSAAAAAQGRPTHMLGGSVSFALPQSWKVEQYANTPTHGAVWVTIPSPGAAKAKLKSEVYLTARVAPEGVTVRHESDGVALNKYEGLAVLSDTFDGENWRTLVWTFRTGGTPYLVLHRFGVEAGKAVELRASLPLAGGGGRKWFERAVADFNSACESLKVGGRNRFEHKVTFDMFAGHVKVSEK